MKTVMSSCGNYMLTYNESNPTGYAQVTEFVGEAPRLIKNYMQIPISLVSSFLGNMETES